MNGLQTLSTGMNSYWFLIFVFRSCFICSISATVYNWQDLSQPVTMNQNEKLVISTQFDNTYLVVQCAAKCQSHGGCLSYRYNARSHSCQLMRAWFAGDEQTTVDDGETETGFVSYNLNTYDIEEDALGLCYTNQPCTNQGKCYDAIRSNGVAAYYCICKNAWRGHDCEERVSIRQWSEWSDWGDCSASCGESGWHSRKRDVININENPTSAVGFVGTQREYKQCNVKACPYWYQWEPWGRCTTETGCGSGYRERKRTCSNGGTANKDRLCMGNSKETMFCQMPACHVPLRINRSETDEEGKGVLTVYNDKTLTWGAVCSHSWSQTETDVACRQLGYEGAAREAAVAAADNKTSAYVGPFVMGDIECKGDETAITRCAHVDWLIQDTCDKPTGISCIVNGNWNDWTEWSSCSVTCADGVYTRSRTCDYPPPLRGGTNCRGNEHAEKPCRKPACPVDGVWKPWSEWQQCNATCGGGMQSRWRICEQPKHNGSECDGPAIEWQACNENHCPVDGYWNDWSSWRECNVTCGGGRQMRNRTCEQPQYGGRNCTGDNDHWRDCNTHPCPVDGQWNPWSKWSPCSVTCANGTRERSRKCQVPLHGGETCEGNATETETCFSVHCPIDGFWGDWSEWEDCSVTCANGTRSRYRNCTQPRYGGDNCAGTSNETEHCFPRFCPVDGEFTTWSSWSTCSLTCGSGSRERHRECLGIQHGGHPCSGAFNQSETCNNLNCPLDGLWSDWSDWTACDVTCGGGNQNRSRDCTGQAHGGNWCVGNDSEVRDCNIYSCPVDGLWSEWSDWTGCDVSCGGGNENRSRDCTGQAHGGRWCAGNNSEVRDCNIHPCPVDGLWSDWSDWTGCDVSCGGGNQNRSRDCTGQAHGGSWCAGNNSEMRDCNIHPCPVDGFFEEWSTWSLCSVTCANGSQTRNRTCVQPMHGGKECGEVTEQTRHCTMVPCPIDGYFDPWSEWSECSVTCATGNQTRTRACNEPLHGGKACGAISQETRNCTMIPCPVDGYFDPWSEWSDCSVTCATGSQARTRTCNEPLHDGKACGPISEETRNCTMVPCPVDGYYGPWSGWSDCSVTCANGTQQRNRTCVQPLHGGSACTDENMQIKQCLMIPCPVDGLWNEWAPWSNCDVTCDSGLQFRNRTCIGQMHGGKSCDGESRERKPCLMDPCITVGNWSSWSEWSSCSLTCDGGTQKRNRSCPADVCPGGGPTDTATCNDFNCYPLAKTCAEWKNRGLKLSGYTQVMPGYDDVIWVFCNMSAENGIGVTVLGHNLLKPVHVNGFEGSGAFERAVEYNGTSKEGVMALVDASLQCRQYVSWQCVLASVHHPEKISRETGRPMVLTFWKNRLGRERYYWDGDQSSYVDYCKCADDDTCVKGDNGKTLTCNCDKNDNVMREDNGYITKKKDLPISAICAGDTGGDDEYGIFTLGPIVCSGQADEDY